MGVCCSEPSRHKYQFVIYSFWLRFLGALPDGLPYTGASSSASAVENMLSQSCPLLWRKTPAPLWLIRDL